MKSNKAFTLVELMIVVAVIGIIAAGIVAYNYVNNVKKAREEMCLRNRGHIESAEQIYVMEKGRHSVSIYDLVEEGYLKSLPECPSGGVYAWAPGSEGTDEAFSVLVCSVHGAREEDAPLTSLGSTFEEITGEMIELIERFYQENGRYPRSWGDYVLTDIGLDPEEWEQAYNGVIYSPAGSRVKIEPAEGYRMTVTDLNGDQRVLTPSLNWNLWYDMKSEKWYYKEIKPGNEVDIDTLVVEKE